MKRQIIAVDIDDVLTNSAEEFVNYSNNKWGTRLKVDDYTEHWAEMWRVDSEETQKRADHIHNSGTHARYKHYKDSARVLKKLKNNYHLIIVTSRHRLVQKDTQDWIEMNYPGIFEEIVFAGIWDAGHDHADANKMTKAELLVDLGVSYLIDDHPKHCIAAAKSGINSLMFGDYAWNRDINVLPKRVIRVRNWNEIGDYFTRINTEDSFRHRVYAVVSQIPRGKVMTYGQISAICGSPRSARIVGGIAHWGDPEFPWQRVVKKDGSLAEGYPGGVPAHEAHLEKEGVNIIDSKVDMDEHLWNPIKK